MVLDGLDQEKKGGVDGETGQEQKQNGEEKNVNGV
jgi:hypothetical protein